MLFPKFHIDEIKKQEARDLTRFDLDFDLPDHFLPEFRALIYLTTRPDFGDVSQGKVVTINNFYDLFNGVLNPKQIEGVRLLVTPFPQQQFNQTADRRSLQPSRGVSCFDCHVNGHTNGATHLVGIFVPNCSVIALMFRLGAESISSGSLDLSGHLRQWKISLSLNSVQLTLMVIQ